VQVGILRKGGSQTGGGWGVFSHVIFEGGSKGPKTRKKACYLAETVSQRDQSSPSVEYPVEKALTWGKGSATINDATFRERGRGRRRIAMERKDHEYRSSGICSKAGKEGQTCVETPSKREKGRQNPKRENLGRTQKKKKREISVPRGLGKREGKKSQKRTRVNE